MNLSSLAATYTAPDPGIYHPMIGGVVWSQAFGQALAQPSGPYTFGQGSNPYPSFGTAPPPPPPARPSPMEGETYPTPGIIDIRPSWMTGPQPFPPPNLGRKGGILRPPPPPPSPPVRAHVGLPPPGVQPGTGPGPSPAPSSGGLPLGWLAAGGALLAFLYFGSQDKKKGRR